MLPLDQCMGIWDAPDDQMTPGLIFPHLLPCVDRLGSLLPRDPLVYTSRFWQFLIILSEIENCYTSQPIIYPTGQLCIPIIDLFRAKDGYIPWVRIGYIAFSALKVN